MSGRRNSTPTVSVGCTSPAKTTEMPPSQRLSDRPGMLYAVPARETVTRTGTARGQRGERRGAKARRGARPAVLMLHLLSSYQQFRSLFRLAKESLIFDSGFAESIAPVFVQCLPANRPAGNRAERKESKGKGQFGLSRAGEAVQNMHNPEPSPGSNSRCRRSKAPDSRPAVDLWPALGCILPTRGTSGLRRGIGRRLREADGLRLSGRRTRQRRFAVVDVKAGVLVIEERRGCHSQGFHFFL